MSSALVMAGIELDEETFLAADVGGTHARLGLITFGDNRDAPTLLAYRTYDCARYAGLEAIVQAFCTEFAAKPRRFALACAGFMDDGAIVHSNLAWPVVPGALARALTLNDVEVLNDFEALAYGTAYLDAASRLPLHVPQPTRAVVAGPVVILGPGTGLGVAVRLPHARPAVLATEAGHIQLAARLGREQQVLGELARADTHVPYDHVLSGPGLSRIYRALCRLERQPMKLDRPEAITAAACAGSDALAVETLQLFCGWLGSYAGDLAMLYGATGGIYMAGGFLTSIVDFLRQSTFSSRFLDKGVMRPFLQKVAVHVVDHAQLGVLGAASWLLARQPQGRTA